MEENNLLHLKKAMKEIDKIIEKYNINAIVLLADGKENGEYKIYHDTPKWSMISFNQKENDKIEAHIKLHMKSNNENTRRTVNSIYCLHGMLKNTLMMNEQLCKLIESHAEITITEK